MSTNTYKRALLVDAADTLDKNILRDLRADSHVKVSVLSHTDSRRTVKLYAHACSSP